MDYSEGKRLDLREQGTRFDHYMELKELWMVGLDIIERRAPGLMTDADKRLKARLEGAIKLIDKRLEHLSDYDTKIFTVTREVEAVHRQLQLTDGKDTKVDPNIAVEEQ